MIKQLMPVPENLTAVMLVTQTDGTTFWEDATRNGTLLILALIDNDEVLPYVIDATGAGTLDDEIQFRPAVYCPVCGQKMWIAPHKDLSEPLAYECPSGDCMRRVKV